MPERCIARVSETEGRRECRMLAAPMARLQQEKQAAVTTGKAGTTGIPCATVYGLYVISPVSGLLSHRPPGALEP
jgi:hypothetical protein